MSSAQFGPRELEFEAPCLQQGLDALLRRELTFLPVSVHRRVLLAITRCCVVGADRAKNVLRAAARADHVLRAAALAVN